MNSQCSARTPDQITLASALFIQLVQSKVQAIVAASGADPTRSGVMMNSPQAQWLWQRLWSFYPAFQRLYRELLLEHLTPEHAPAVLAELEREPLQRYLRARQAMTSELTTQLQLLSRRMGTIEI